MANPFLNKSFSQSPTLVLHNHEVMTRAGVLNKSIFLFILTLLSASATWGVVFRGINPSSYALTGALLGFAMALIASFKPNWSPYLAPVYSLAEGVFLGAFSAVVHARYPGLPLQAVLATFVTFLLMLSLYRMKIIRVTERFRSVLFGATLAIATYYLIAWVASSFFQVIPFNFGASWLSIAFSVFVIIIAALNLAVDFDFIERQLAQRAPKYMEWFSAMALMITLIWLYIEILNLLSKINKND